MIWEERFRIGDGEKVSEEQAVPVYRAYDECGILMTQQLFKEIVRECVIYEETTLLKDIQFTPHNVPKQTMSNYYFAKLDVKIPHRT